MSLAAKTVWGIAWTLLANGSARVITLVGTLLLVRRLDQAEYGEVLGAAVISSTAMALSSLGMGQYVIAHPRAGRDHVFHVTVYSALACALLCVAMLLFAHPIATYFRVTHVMRYLPLLACAAFLDRIVSVPERVLVRDMRFRLVGIGNASGELAYTAVSLGAVYLGRGLGVGAMAIVYANLARPILRFAIFSTGCPLKEWLTPSPLSLETSFTIFSFGVPIAIGGLADFAARRWDGLLINRFFGPAVLARYNLAGHLADVPSSQLGEQVGDVLLPSFAHLDGEARKGALARSMRLLGLLVFPLGFGLAATAPTASNLFFGDHFPGIEKMLAMMCALSFARPITFVMMSYLQAANRTQILSLLEVGKLAVLLGTLFLVGDKSPILACTAIGIAFFAQLFVGLAILGVVDGVPVLSALFGLVPPLLACAPMALAVIGVRSLLGAHRFYAGPAGLLLEIAAGAIVYVGAAFVFAPTTTRDLLGLIRNTLRRRVASTASAASGTARSTVRSDQ